MSGNRSKSADAGGLPLLPSRITSPDILVFEVRQLQAMLVQRFPREKGGWRAAEPGVQTIRLIFDQPQRVRRISVVFEETENQSTQEFTLRWSSDRGGSFREIVRQQWNFSSPDATREIEEYNVDLSNVTLLDLIIDPDKGNGKAQASLLRLHLA